MISAFLLILAFRLMFLRHGWLDFAKSDVECFHAKGKHHGEINVALGHVMT